MSAFEQVLRDELEELKRQLRANPVFLKYEQLKETAKLYGIEAETLGRPLGEPKKPAFYTGRGTGKISRAANPERDRTLGFAAKVLEGRTDPVKTAEIYELILPMGAKIGGTEPKSNLSAMLHHSETFKSHGRAGWTLAKYSLAEPPPQFGYWDDTDDEPGIPETDDEGDPEDLLA